MNDPIIQALRDFVTTSNSGKYKSEQELLSKFPELKGYDIQSLRDFVSTSNSGKYKTEEELLSKFPEFFGEAKVSQASSTKPPKLPGPQDLSVDTPTSKPSIQESVTKKPEPIDTKAWGSAEMFTAGSTKVPIIPIAEATKKPEPIDTKAWGSAEMFGSTKPEQSMKIQKVQKAEEAKAQVVQSNPVAGQINQAIANIGPVSAENSKQWRLEVFNKKSFKDQDINNPLVVASKYLGINEDDPKQLDTIYGFYSSAIDSPETALNVKTKEQLAGDVAWCGAFVKHILSEMGVEGVAKKKGYEYLRAKDYASIGERIPSIGQAKPGDLVVKMNPRGQYHVGFYAGRDPMDPKRILMLGGNQNDSVSVNSYPINEVKSINRIPSIEDIPQETLSLLSKDISYSQSDR
jgi:uncharacterized protein (TIGR02594 family)